MSELMASQIDRYAKLPAGEGERSTIDLAVQALTKPFTYNEPIAKDLSPLLLKLLKHSNPEVRRHSQYALITWKEFPEDERRAQALKFLADPDELVRAKMIDKFWSPSSRLDGMEFIDTLSKIAAVDPVERIRSSAADTIEEIKKEHAAKCERAALPKK